MSDFEKMIESLTVEKMQADGAIALAKTRLIANLPFTREIEAAFMLGFCEGSDWARKIVAEVAKR